MPRTYRFGREHTLFFERAWTNATWTLPAMGTMFTGQYPGTHVFRREPESDRYSPTLAQMLYEAGYETVAFSANRILNRDSPMTDGFEEFSTASLVATIMDEVQPDGEGTVTWDQMDYSGEQTPPGSYELHFTAADYDTTLNFEITESAGLSGADQSASAQTPTSASVWMDSYTHASGTPIRIHYSLPEEARVTMQVFVK